MSYFKKQYAPLLDVEPSACFSDQCKSFMNSKHMQNLLGLIGDRKILCLMVHGSHLYGLNHADSDIDMKGVFMPTPREIILGSSPKTIKFSSGDDNSKNSRDDVDVELYSVGHFFKLAKNGDTGVISMMNAPDDMVCVQTEAWKAILRQKSMLYSKSMAGLIGFVLNQTSKYCMKGNRIREAKDALNFLEAGDPDSKLRDCWNDLPMGDFLFEIEKDGNVFWSVCNRMIQDTSKFSYATDIVRSVLLSYGKRAQTAYENEGLDWKAISHALRVANELSDLYKFGNIKYPLRNSTFIKMVKMGEVDFNSKVLPILNSLMDEVNSAALLSDFPDQIDVKKIDDFLYYLIKMSI